MSRLANYAAGGKPGLPGSVDGTVTSTATECKSERIRVNGNCRQPGLAMAAWLQCLSVGDAASGWTTPLNALSFALCFATALIAAIAAEAPLAGAADAGVCENTSRQRASGGTLGTDAGVGMGGGHAAAISGL